jgi:hypothetical protein
MLTNKKTRMKQLQYKGKFDAKGASVDFQLPVISFIEDNTHIIYCPALDLSGYGNDEFEARASLDTVLEEYLIYTMNKKTLWTDLKKLGWSIKRNKQKPATPPPMSELLEKNQEFSRIFNTLPFKKFNTGVRIPVHA